MRPLRELQSELLRSIESGGRPDESLRSLLLPSQRMPVEARLAVYQNAYRARLVECLQSLCPAFAAAVGDEAFQAMAFEYVNAHPPDSYSLNDLALRFPEYLRATCPRENGQLWEGGLFLAELARFELCLDQVFDGPGIEDREPWDPGTIPTDEEWLSTRLLAAPCLRLEAFEFPVEPFYSAWKCESGLSGETPPWPRREPTWLALTRLEYRVIRIPLKSWEYRLLCLLVAGSTVGDALGQIADRSVDAAAIRACFAISARNRFWSGNLG
ncbi:MAG: DUF2063 domain-containing protein [Planctomycetes bacterium]|nr:DUF2063 domain-containing protein [Planctomycetota bacterium]